MRLIIVFNLVFFSFSFLLGRGIIADSIFEGEVDTIPFIEDKPLKPSTLFSPFLTSTINYGCVWMREFHELM